MKSVIATAALGAALFGQAAIARSLGQHNAHHMAHAAAHRRAEVEEAEKRGLISSVISALSDADAAILEDLGVLSGANVGNSSDSTTPVTLGAYGGAYVAEFTNESDEDLILVVWDSGLKAWVNVDQPAITRTLKVNHTVHVSFDPSVNNGAVSGAWAMINTNTTLVDGLVSNTWGEYTFEETGAFSTIDISREPNMDGSAMTIEIYETKADANDDTVDAACYADMKTCAFVCTDGSNTCGDANTYEIINCSGAGTTSDGSTNGGCAGMDSATGWIVVKAY